MTNPPGCLRVEVQPQLTNISPISFTVNHSITSPLAQYKMSSASEQQFRRRNTLMQRHHRPIVSSLYELWTKKARNPNQQMNPSSDKQK
jgi:hypothetical protein